MSPLLFWEAAIFDVLQQRQEEIKAEVAAIPASAFDEIPDKQLVREVATKFKLELPILEEDRICQSSREVDVDVSGDPMRLIWDRSRPFYVKAAEITVTIPFKGDVNLFRIRPSTFSTNPPRGEVEGTELHLSFRRIDNDGAALKRDFEQALASIKQHLGWLEQDVARFNGAIGTQIQGLVAQRKQAVAARAEMVAALGLPPRRKEMLSAGERVSEDVAAKSIRSSKKWDVFISHATEDKEDVARPLAVALQKAGLAVWFDEFSLRMGDSLRSSIDYGLANSRYGVVILSAGFFGRHWPSQELNGLAGREVNGKKVLLPIWHKITVDEVRSYSPMLADRVAVRSDEGVDAMVAGIMEVLKAD